MIDPTKCLLCGEPLTEDEISRRRTWHEKCNVCPVCSHGPLDEDMLIRQLASGAAFGHTGCLDSQAMRDLKDKTIPMRLEQIDQLNREMTTQWIIEPLKLDVEQLYKILIKLQTTAANVSTVLGKTKDKIMVRERDDYRQQTKEQREAERLSTRNAAQAEIDKTKRQAELAAERENPGLKLKRKAIEGWVKSGMSLEVATKMVEEMEAKKQ